MRHWKQILLCLVVMVLTACSMGGARQVTVVDNDAKELKDVVVLPLYNASYGIGFGPDGHGPWTTPKVFTKPFRFNSGEDLMNKQMQGRGIIIPPFIFIGTSKHVESWLFMKKGYTPLTVDDTQIYGGSPILMTRSNNEANNKCIDLLLAKKPDQEELRKLFNATRLKGNIKVDIDTNDVTLLNSHRGET